MSFRSTKTERTR